MEGVLDHEVDGSGPELLVAHGVGGH